MAVELNTWTLIMPAILFMLFNYVEFDLIKTLKNNE